jgi:orotate phosphoribosyltransferase
MWNYCRDFIEHSGIYRCKPGDNLPAKNPTKRYTWQFYLRRCLFDAKFANAIGTLLWERIADKEPFQLGACEAAGVPVATAIQVLAFQNGREIPIISIKKERKAYGLLNWTEGPLNTSLPVLLVDDLAASQQTLKKAAQLILDNKLKLHKNYICIVDKRGPNCEGHSDAYIPNLELISLFNTGDFSLGWYEYRTKYDRESMFGPYL